MAIGHSVAQSSSSLRTKRPGWRSATKSATTATGYTALYERMIPFTSNCNLSLTLACATAM
eukprot:2774169-Prymnesium_polylepis.1